MYGNESLTLREVYQKYLDSFEMWLWGRLDVSWTDRMIKEVLHRIKKEGNVINTIKRRKGN